jgi:hypothetical protein
VGAFKEWAKYDKFFEKHIPILTDILVDNDESNAPKGIVSR